MFLYGDSLRSSCVAIIVPDEEVLLAWAASNGRPNVSFEELCLEAVIIYILILYMCVCFISSTVYLNI